jgi:hypothetical protein
LANGDSCLTLDPENRIEASLVHVGKLQCNFRLADTTAAIYGVSSKRLVTFGAQVLFDLVHFRSSAVEPVILTVWQNHVWEGSWFLALRDQGMSQGQILDLTVLICSRVASDIVQMLHDSVQLFEIEVDGLTVVGPRLLSSRVWEALLVTKNSQLKRLQGR